MAGKGKVLTGARSRLLIDGVKVGSTTAVTIREEVQYDPADYLDNIETDEHVPIAYRVNVTARRIRIVGETLKSMGYFANTGKTVEEHLENILVLGEMVMTLEDSKTKKILATVEGLKIASMNYNVDRGGIVGEDIEFVARRSSDESEIT